MPCTAPALQEGMGMSLLHWFLSTEVLLGCRAEGALLAGTRQGQDAFIPLLQGEIHFLRGMLKVCQHRGELFPFV